MCCGTLTEHIRPSRMPQPMDLQASFMAQSEKVKHDEQNHIKQQANPSSLSEAWQNVLSVFSLHALCLT